VYFFTCYAFLKLLVCCKCWVRFGENVDGWIDDDLVFECMKK
jgi:hypothetical protein